MLFMVVLTRMGNFPYQRNDSVFVVPIGRLKDCGFDIKNFIKEELVNYKAKAQEEAK